MNNILQLCHRVPYPPNDGGNIAMLSLTKAMDLQGIGVKLLTLNTKKHFVDPVSLPDDFRKKYSIESVYIDTSVKVIPALFNVFNSDSYNISRFFSDAFNKKLISVLKENKYDAVLLESLFMAPYIKTIREYSKTKIVLRAHNVEYIIWERLAVNEKNILKRKYFSFLAARLKKYELEAINKVDAIVPITEDDGLKFIASGKPMLTVPVGINLEEFPERQIGIQERNPSFFSLFHLGAMDWMPNLEGVQWFLKNCWPMIHQRLPTLNLFLAGRGFPDTLKNNAPENVICEGEITDAKKYMSDKQIMIVPLLSGGGMRVKIIQGMAMGKTIISTSIGAEGIKIEDGKNILIADTPAQFLQQVVKCLEDQDWCLSIGRSARELVANHYSNEAIGKKVNAFLRQVVALK